METSLPNRRQLNIGISSNVNYVIIIISSSSSNNSNSNSNNIIILVLIVVVVNVSELQVKPLLQLLFDYDTTIRHDYDEKLTFIFCSRRIASNGSRRARYVAVES